MHVLHCGHGNTILVHLPGDRWALIDCHLRAEAVRNRFFDFLEMHRVDRLDLLCLTHPHADHFTGMLDVIEHFTQPGRSIGTYCDSGVDPAQVRDILRAENRPKSEISEYERIQRRLDKLIDSDVIRYYRVDENSHPIAIKGTRNAELRPMAPDPVVVRRMTRAALQSGKIRGSVNAISLILLLRIRSSDDGFHALLAGDAETGAMERVLSQWRDRENGALELDAIKVPHHGSVKSHTPHLAQTKRRKGEGVAAISAGRRRALPDREVVRAYMDAGWLVLATTTRHEVPHRVDSPLTLSGKPSELPSSFQEQTVHITWDPVHGLVWEPDVARIEEERLAVYTSAIA